MSKKKAIIYYCNSTKTGVRCEKRVCTCEDGSKRLEFYSVSNSGLPDTRDTITEEQYSTLCSVAESMELEVVDDVVVYEPTYSLDRPGWRKAVGLALLNNADIILVLNSMHVTNKRVEYRTLTQGLNSMGVKIVAKVD